MNANATERVGRYQLLEPIGIGPTGEVSRAKVFGVAGFERQFALKRFHTELTQAAAMAQAVSAAARAYGSLEHPRIARMSEFGVAQGVTFTAVELVAGLDVLRLLSEAKLAGQTLAPGGTLTLISQTARAVGYAHGRGISHLGLAPTNVIVTPDGDVKITDFGVFAATVPAKPETVARLAKRIGYLSPEQIAGEATSAATDVFALGVLAYELVTGGRAFAGATPAAVAQAITSGPPPEPPLPRPIVRVLQRCLARSPFERFPDARALADALDAALRVAPVPGTRKDIGAQVQEIMDRLATLNEGGQSGVVALNVGTGPVRKLDAADVGAVGGLFANGAAPPPKPPLRPAPNDTVPNFTDQPTDAIRSLHETNPHDAPTFPFVRPDLEVPGPSPATTIPDMKQAPYSTMAGIAPPPIPVPQGVAPPPGALHAPIGAPAATLLGLPPLTPQQRAGAIGAAGTSRIPNIKPLTPSVVPPHTISPRPPTSPPLPPDLEPPKAARQTPPPLRLPTSDVALLPAKRPSGYAPDGLRPGGLPPLPPGATRAPSEAGDAGPLESFAAQPDAEAGTSLGLGFAEQQRMATATGAPDAEVKRPTDQIAPLQPPPPVGPTPSSTPQLSAPLIALEDLLADDGLSQAGRLPTDAPPPPPVPPQPEQPPPMPVFAPPPAPVPVPVQPRTPHTPYVRPGTIGADDLDDKKKKRSALPWIIGGVLGLGALGFVGYEVYDVLTDDSDVAPPIAFTPKKPVKKPVIDPPVTAPADAAVIAAATTPDAKAAVPVDAPAPIDAAAPPPAVDAAAVVATAPADAPPPPPADAPAVKPVTPSTGGSASELVITSTPPGAHVFLDGSDVGVTPAKLPGSADRHNLSLLLAGHDLYVAQVDGHGTFPIALKDVTPPGGPAGIKVIKCKEPNRFYVYVDGKPTGMMCPTERIECAVGPHTVEVYDAQTEQRKKFDINVTDTRLSYRVRLE